MIYDEFLKLAGLSSNLCTLMEYTKYIEPVYSKSLLEKETWWMTNANVIIKFLLRERGKEISLLREQIDNLNCDLDRQEKIVQELKISREVDKKAVIKDLADIIDALKEEEND